MMQKARFLRCLCTERCTYLSWCEQQIFIMSNWLRALAQQNPICGEPEEEPLSVQYLRALEKASKP